MLTCVQDVEEADGGTVMTIGLRRWIEAQVGTEEDARRESLERLKVKR